MALALALATLAGLTLAPISSTAARPRRHCPIFPANNALNRDISHAPVDPNSDGWTSADAAGLPIMPLLVRYEEVGAGHIDHALRMTVQRTQAGFIHPATHFASSSADPALPPMGLRLRLKASFDLSPYHGQALVVLRALKRYGLIVADNGSNWYITGAPDRRWNDEDLDQLKRVPGSALEAVRTGPILRG